MRHPTLYRLIKPMWGRRSIKKRGSGEWKSNPDFKKDVPGLEVQEGYFDNQYLQEQSELGFNIYYFPNPPDQKPQEWTNDTHVTSFGWVFIDVDFEGSAQATKQYVGKDDCLADLKSFSLQPSRIVDSGAGIHAYWRVNDLKLESFLELQLRLIERFGSDPTITNPSRIMRRWGYQNTKRFGDFRDCVLVDEKDRNYTVAELRGVLPILPAVGQSKLANNIARATDGPKMRRHKNRRAVPAELSADLRAVLDSDDLSRALFDDPVGQCGDRSSADMALELPGFRRAVLYAA